MLSQIETSWRRWKDRLNAGEWYLRWKRFSTTATSRSEPGLLLVQIEGWQPDEFRQRGPKEHRFLQSLLAQQHYQLHSLQLPVGEDPALIEKFIAFGDEGARQGLDGVHEHGRPPGLFADGSVWGGRIAGGARRDEVHDWAGLALIPRHRRNLRLRLGPSLDVRRGLATVWVTLRVSDAVPLTKGPKRVDQLCQRWYEAARNAWRRDYQVWFLILPSWSPGLVGGHREGLVLVPPDVRFRVAEPGRHPVTLGAVHRALAAVLHLEAPIEPSAASSITPETWRVATYNAHRCIGMDGRITPRRIARVIDQLGADVVAVQELDHGHARSGLVHQAEKLAALTGTRCIFCPTVVSGHAEYGHAVLVRGPAHVVKIGVLPTLGRTRIHEVRGVIWVRIRFGTRDVNVFSTHLGLTRADRTAQIEVLLGSDWIGSLGPDDPIVLMGDLNLSPGGANYRRLTSRLHDAQLHSPSGPPLRTFSTWHPIARIDHVFLSSHFRVSGASSLRTHLTRVASDHFPLVVDLGWKTVLQPAADLKDDHDQRERVDTHQHRR